MQVAEMTVFSKSEALTQIFTSGRKNNTVLPWDFKLSGRINGCVGVNMCTQERKIKLQISA